MPDSDEKLAQELHRLKDKLAALANPGLPVAEQARLNDEILALREDLKRLRSDLDDEREKWRPH